MIYIKHTKNTPQGAEEQKDPQGRNGFLTGKRRRSEGKFCKKDKWRRGKWVSMQKMQKNCSAL